MQSKAFAKTARKGFFILDHISFYFIIIPMATNTQSLKNVIDLTAIPLKIRSKIQRKDNDDSSNNICIVFEGL